MKKGKKEIEYYTWPDKIAGQLKGKKHVIHGMWTPSGYFHIGNSRTELFIPGLVHQALIDKGLKSIQNLLVDDFDDFDRVPAGFDKERFSEFLGKPLVNVPSPVKGYDSWAEYFTEELVSSIDKFGLSPNFISAYNAYRKGVYNDAIKIVLDNARKVRDIWVRITKSEKPIDWLPIIIVCENCGKSATTIGLDWDGKKLKYSCSNDREYCKSCGHTGEVLPKNGKVKLPWRVHWAAGWYIYGTTFESAGKDHFTEGGSVDTSRAFCKEIFKKEPPIQIPAEFIQLGKERMAGSRGNVITMKDWLGFAEPELLRFLMLSYQPNTVIDFDLQSNKLFLLADRYDKTERIYFGEKVDDKKKESQAKREYELSQIKKPKKRIQIDYSTAVMISQTCPNKNLDEIINLLKKMGIVNKKISKYDRSRISKRLSLAKNWADKYAPEELRIKVQENIPQALINELTDNEKKAISILAKELDSKDLQSRIYEIARENNIEPKRFFKILYEILINRESGPRLGPFIIAIGKEKVRKIFKQI